MDIKAKIRQYVAENFLYSSDGFHLSDDASFLEEEVIDSTGVMELVMFVEEEFKITVDDEDIVPENFDSVNQLAAYIAQKK
ncbi:MAG: acyl carrier protein [Chloroflexota bacterium]|nr:acyl carrier protein [Anaerolineales bacterium]MCB8967094.1 acyl carrier protein [Ardenticatenaceae bacterium]